MANNGSRPFSIRIYLPDGDPDGAKVIDKSHWTGRGITFSRPIFPVVKIRDEFQLPGVYVLVGPSDDGDMPKIYIGEGDPVKPRLDSHYANKDFWTWATFFTTKDGTLNKAHIQHLESRLIGLATEAKKAHLDNQNNPSKPALSEAELADAESFLEDMLSIFPLLGLSVFEKPKIAKKTKSTLHIEAKGIRAEGYESAQGLVVFKGSQAVLDEVPSIHRYMSTLRGELIHKGVFQKMNDHFLFTQDYAFNSPSTAAGVILGRPANGRTDWKDGSGKTLKEIQESEATD
jgi:hypothetical protein